MADDQRRRNALIQKVKQRLRQVGVSLDTNIRWKVTQTFDAPEGFEFTHDQPLILQRLAEKSSQMALDFDYPTPSGLADWSQSSVGFTEVGEGTRVHLDIGIDGVKQCRAFLDPKSNVVGRDDKTGFAQRNLQNRLVDQVKRAAFRIGIPLDDYGCQVIKIYDNRVEPTGFDFRCSPEDIRKLWSLVRSHERFKFDDPEAKIEGGWFNQIATHGYGYREKGYGPRLHIEIAPNENFGNIHVDSHGFVREDGTYDWHEAATEHGPLDLVSGPLGGHLGPVGILPFGSLSLMKDRDHEATLIGLPDGRIVPANDLRPDGRDGGWRIVGGIRLTW